MPLFDSGFVIWARKEQQCRKGTFFRLQVYESVGISLVKVFLVLFSIHILKMMQVLDISGLRGELGRVSKSN